MQKLGLEQKLDTRQRACMHVQMSRHDGGGGEGRGGGGGGEAVLFSLFFSLFFSPEPQG